MKSIKIILFVVLGLLVGISNMEAQQNQNNSNNNSAALEALTEQQRLMIQEQRELIKQKREMFKASLTEEQLAIFENKELTKQERHDALMLSLTDAQNLLLQEHRENVAQSKYQFRNTITSEQRQQIRTRLGTNKESQSGNELRRNVRDHRTRQRNNKGGN